MARYLIVARKRPGRHLRAIVEGWPYAVGWQFFLLLRGWTVDKSRV